MTGPAGGREAGSVSRPLRWAAEELWNLDPVSGRVLGIVALAGVVYTIVAAHETGFFSGKHLGTLLLTIVVSAMYLSWTVVHFRSPRMVIVTVLVLGVAGGVLGAWAPGAGAYFPFIAMFTAGRRLSPRVAVGCAAATIAAFDGTALLTGRLTILGALGISVGLLAALLGGVNRASRRHMQEQAELIVAEGQVIAEERARSAALAERARIAREIHDVLAHSLSGLMVQLEAANLLLTQDAEPARVAGHVDRARGLARTGMEETRRALQALRGEAPEVHDQLAELAEGYRSDTGCPADLAVSGTPMPLNADIGMTLCRVAREALTNVRRHAPGARAELHVSYEKDAVLLTVTDHRTDPAPVGGASPPDTGSGYGLIGMRERAELLGGELAAGRTADGWQVSLRVPV